MESDFSGADCLRNRNANAIEKWDALKLVGCIAVASIVLVQVMVDF